MPKTNGCDCDNPHTDDVCDTSDYSSDSDNSADNHGYALSNEDINDFIEIVRHRGLIPKSQRFLGVFPRDRIPHTNPGDFYVANLDTTGRPGTHWVAALQRPKELLYFDSYGLVPPTEAAERAGGDRIVYNNAQLQADDSVVCGWMCIYILCQLCAGRSYIDVITDFYPGPSKDNEEAIYDWFDALLRH